MGFTKTQKIHIFLNFLRILYFSLKSTIFLTFSFLFKSEAFVNKGYSPLLNFHVDNIEKTIEEIKSYGGNLDGEIITEEDFKVNFIKKMSNFHYFS